MKYLIVLYCVGVFCYVVRQTWLQGYREHQAAKQAILMARIRSFGQILVTFSVNTRGFTAAAISAAEAMKSFSDAFAKIRAVTGTGTERVVGRDDDRINRPRRDYRSGLGEPPVAPPL